MVMLPLKAVQGQERGLGIPHILVAISNLCLIFMSLYSLYRLSLVASMSLFSLALPLE